MTALEALKQAEDNIQQVGLSLQAHGQIQHIFKTIRSQAAAEQAAIDVAAAQQEKSEPSA